MEKNITFCAVVKTDFRDSEEVAQRCFIKEVFYKILQNSQKYTCVGVSILTKLHAEDLQIYSKKTPSRVLL